MKSCLAGASLFFFRPDCRANYISLYIAFIKCQPRKVDLEAQAQEMQDWNLNYPNLMLNLNIIKCETNSMKTNLVFENELQIHKPMICIINFKPIVSFYLTDHQFQIYLPSRILIM